MPKPEATGVNPNVNTVPGSEFQANSDLTGNDALDVKVASGGEFYDMKCNPNTKCDPKCTCAVDCDCTKNPNCNCTFVKKV